MDFLLHKLAIIGVPMMGTSNVRLSMSSMQYVKKKKLKKKTSNVQAPEKRNKLRHAKNHKTEFHRRL